LRQIEVIARRYFAAFAEIESIDIGHVGAAKISAFAPSHLLVVKSSDALEGVLFIPSHQSPLKKSLLIVSSENDGVIKIYRSQ